MRSVDLRSRTADDLRAIDVDAFLGVELPGLSAQRSGRVAPAFPHGLRSLGLSVGDRDWTLALDGGRIVTSPGLETVSAHWRISDESLDHLVADLVTPMAFLAAGELDQPAGSFDDLLDWWVVLRAVLDDQRAHVAGDIAFVGRDGQPLDLNRSFTLDDDPAEVNHFLAEAGFLHLAGVYTDDEMAAVSADMDAAAENYRPGDGQSWWATVADGTERLVRMQRFQERSSAVADLLSDPRLLGLASLTPDGHRHGKPGPNLVEALVKPIGVRQGISDVPWHKDCSLGGHAYRCCSLTVGISVTGADASSGQLRVIPGSHRALIPPVFVRPDLDLAPLELPTRTGDVTVHLSCTLHMSQPPVDRERRVLYTDFSLPSDGLDLAEEVVGRVRKAAPTEISQQAAG